MKKRFKHWNTSWFFYPPKWGTPPKIWWFRPSPSRSQLRLPRVVVGKWIFSNMFPTCRSLIYLFKIVMFQSCVSLLKLTSYCQVRKPWQEATTALLRTPHRLVAWRALQELQDLQDGLGGRKHHPHVQPTHGSKPFTGAWPYWGEKTSQIQLLKSSPNLLGWVRFLSVEPKVIAGCPSMDSILLLGPVAPAWSWCRR